MFNYTGIFMAKKPIQVIAVEGELKTYSKLLKMKNLSFFISF
jgi:hypothetical protein